MCVGTASAQFGFGIVYDPTNYSNALLRYYQLQQHLVQLKNSYAQLIAQYNLALQMAQYIQNMPARYRAHVFAVAKCDLAQTPSATRARGLAASTPACFPPSTPATSRPPRRCFHTARTNSRGMTPDELERVQSQYASVELADGANTTAMATIGSIRGDSQNIQTQINNLEQDSFSADPNLNTEVSVLNKINAAGVLTLRTLQDSNKLLASLLEQQTILAKQQREATTNAINADIERQASLAGNMAQVTSTLTDSLQNFRMP